MRIEKIDEYNTSTKIHVDSYDELHEICFDIEKEEITDRNSDATNKLVFYYDDRGFDYGFLFKNETIFSSDKISSGIRKDLLEKLFDVEIIEEKKKTKVRTISKFEYSGKYIEFWFEEDNSEPYHHCDKVYIFEEKLIEAFEGVKGYDYVGLKMNLKYNNPNWEIEKVWRE